MNKTALAEGIIRYSFDPKPGKHFASNIYALISDGKVLLIDTGYEPEGAQIAADLAQNGLQLAGVIITHFHDDHMQGLRALPKVPVYGSARFQSTLDLWTEKTDHPYFKPDVEIADTVALNFGGRRISIMASPGHSACTVLVRIGDAYLHVSDELMFSPEQEPLLPTADPGCLEVHIASLRRLKAYSALTFLPAHGLPLSGAQEIERQIDKRLAYLSAVLAAGGRISYEEASKDSGAFLHSEWHADNCIKQ